MTAVQIEIEGNTVRISRPASSFTQRAVILGRLREDGRERVYLDRRVHDQDTVDANGNWTFDGGYTTVLN